MRILFVTPYIPSLIRVRSYNLIRTLAALGHQVHLVALQPPGENGVSADGLRDVCERVDIFRLSRARALRNGLGALPTSYPLQAAYSRHPQAKHHLRQLVDSGRYDVLHVEHLRGAVLAEGLSGIPRVFDSVDSITYLFEQTRHLAPRFSHRLMARLDLWRTRRFEASAPLRFERTLVTSPVDAQMLNKLSNYQAQGRIVLLPNAVDLDYFRAVDPSPEAATILFSGKMSYHANVAAALYLAHEIMPHVWEQRPDAKLMIVGKDPASSIRALSNDPQITVTGFVPDLRPYFARATLAVSPLLYGAGTQYKVLEAMASAVPTVVTPRVVGGLQAQPGRDLLVGDSPTELARQVLELLGDPSLRHNVGHAGLRYVERHHHWPSIAKILVAEYHAITEKAQHE